jgi:hypothetical protein
MSTSRLARISLVALSAALTANVSAVASEDRRAKAHADLDAWLDARPARETAAQIAKRFKDAGLAEADVEALLRAGRSRYSAAPAPLGTVSDPLPLRCDHVDYATTYLLRLPAAYDPAKAWPLVLIGHGGNAEMSQERAEETARSYMEAYLAGAPDDVILAAPATARGWDWIGYSVLFSLVSKLSREVHVDPDRVYAVGQSMGGHMAWRLGIFFGDRFGAVSPMSGGYDFVENGQVVSLFDVPGYATHGQEEPYRIAEFNRKIKAYADAHRYPWTIVEKPGGHEIFADEVPKAFAFFREHPRDLRRDRVAVRATGPLRIDHGEPKKDGWPTDHVWVKDRPIVFETFGWVRVFPLPEDTSPLKAVQRAWVVRKSRSEIEVTARNVPRMRLYLSPDRFDLEKPLTVVVNGRRTTAVVRRDLAAMLELVKEFDDRGRIFPAFADLKIASDADVPDPMGP